MVTTIVLMGPLMPENFGIVAIEEPFATRISDIPEILGSCGRIIEPEPPRQLAAAIAHLIDHPNQTKALGRETRHGMY
jgi:hypothetical protein